MTKHKETGIKGEQIAENFLLRKGYTILERNWRLGK
jgi:putative endonuclease